MKSNNTKFSGHFPGFENMYLDNTGNVKKTKTVLKGCYNVYYKKWMEYFKREQIHIINGDTFTKDPFNQIKKVENFLGLEPYFTKDHFVFDEQKGFYCKHFESGQRECMKEGKGRKHPVIEDGILGKFRDFYRIHNIRFMRLTGMKFEWM